MIMREIGKTGIKVTAVGMGTWAIGGDERWGYVIDEATAIRAIHNALDNGINFIDTAPAYGFGHSEQIVGKALKGRRDKVVLIDKCGLNFDGVGSPHLKRDGAVIARNLSREDIFRSVEQSLRDLGTDYIDVLMTHHQSIPPFFTPIEETVAAMLDLKKEGKIRAISAANVSMDHIKSYLNAGALDLVQMRYSMLDRGAEKDILPFCEQNGITFQCYSPLEQGLLTGKITMDYVRSEKDVRNRIPWYEPQNLRKVLDMLERWRPLLAKYDCSLANLAIAWTVAQGECMNVLFGARRPEHVLDNIKGGAILLDKADVESMRRDVEALTCES